MTREELIVQVQKRVSDDFMFRGSTVELKDQDLKGNYRVAVLLNGKPTRNEERAHDFSRGMNPTHNFGI